MTKKTTYEDVLETVRNADLLKASVSRRDALKTSGLGAAALALAGTPLALSLASQPALAQGSGSLAVLQRVEAFFQAFLAQRSTLVGAQALTADEAAALTLISSQTTAHISWTGSITAPAYDWSGGSGSGGVGTGKGPFTPTLLLTKTNYLTQLRYFADFRVRAYAGQLADLFGSANFNTAFAVRLNAARHVASIRLLANTNSTILASSDVPAAGTAQPTNLGTAGDTTVTPVIPATPIATAQTNLRWFIYGPPRATSTDTGSDGEDNRNSINGALGASADAFDMPLSTTRVNAVLAFFNA